ncbi:MAG: GNAT family N-acetyltransferase [Chitinophagaceae bacterium]
MPASWICKKYDELTIDELYAILQLRIEVFIVEQKCAFQDADNKDRHCFHLMCWNDGDLSAYSRLVPAAVSFNEISIGRVITSSASRRTGLGKQLMEKSIENCYSLFGKQPVRIGAQLYLKKFYESVGFLPAGPVYLEDGIEHMEMILNG